MRYLACLHQNLCLCPALFLQMDLKLHLKITKIYKISNNDISDIETDRVGVSQKMIPRERLTGFSFFLPTPSACLPLLP